MTSDISIETEVEAILRSCGPIPNRTAEAGNVVVFSCASRCSAVTENPGGLWLDPDFEDRWVDAMDGLLGDRDPDGPSDAEFERFSTTAIAVAAAANDAGTSTGL